MRRWVILWILLIPAWAFAQGDAARLAFTNGSGQLVVAEVPSGTRWIVTNPGELLAGPVEWSPEGAQLFYAVQSGGDVSLRIADPASQRITDLGIEAGPFTGAEWTPDGRNVLVGVGDGLIVAGGGQGAIVGAQPLTASGSRTISPAGLPTALYWQDGRYVVAEAESALPVSNSADARGSGLWSDDGVLVAAWGTGQNGTSVLVVANGETGDALSLDSGSTVPATPVGWVPGTTQLVYRDANAQIRVADLACLSGGCSGNPLEGGALLLPPTATSIQLLDGGAVLYRNGDALQAVDVGCGNNCTGTTVAQGVGGTLFAHGDTAAYTGRDNRAYALDLACLSDPATCSPRPVAGFGVQSLSSNGAFVLVQANDGSLSAVSVDDLSVLPLGAAGSGSPQWN